MIAEVLGYVGGALAVVAALFLGAELWDELGPWPRVLLLGAVAVACLGAGAALGGRDGAPGRLGGFLWAAAVIAVAATAGVAADDLAVAEPGTSALAAAVVALVVAAVLWWWRPAVLAAHRHVRRGRRDAAHRASTGSATARSTGAGRCCGASGWPGWPPRPSPDRQHKPDDGPAGIWTPAEPGWVLGALAVVVGPLFAQSGRAGWLVVGSLGAAALVVVGVRTRNPWVAAVGIGGVFVSVPLAVAELFDARLGPLVGILAVGLALVAAAVVLTRRAAR